MISARLSSLRFLACQLFVATASFVATSAQEIVYDNTTTFLGRYAPEATEAGDEVILAGTARVLTDIYFEYFGDFTAQGDELAKVRIYTNEKIYDLYRNEPTMVLYESGYFPVSPGYNTKHLPVPDVTVPDVVTFTIEFAGLADAEQAGLLLYSPLTVGRSFNEFWVRNEAGIWLPIIYSRTDPTLKLNAALRLMAKDALSLRSPKLSAAQKFGFSIKGLRVGTYVVESSSDLVNWTQVETKLAIGQIASFERAVDANKKNLFYRVRSE